MTPTKVYLHQAFRCCPYAGAISSQIHDYLQHNHYTLVNDPQEANVHLINTCGSDRRQADLTWDVLRVIQQQNKDVTVVTTGCLVSIEAKAMQAALSVFPRHHALDPRHLNDLDEIFSAETPFSQIPLSLHNDYRGNDFSEGWSHILASTGCLGSCSFCAIRRATGRPKSRSIEMILADIARSVEQGIRDILLVSTDLSAWGVDRGESIVDLLKAVVSAPGEFLISGESFEPTLFLTHFEELLPLLSSGRFAFVGLPIQSGSQRVLSKMNRFYHPDAILAAVQRLKQAAPQLLLRTDILYGFEDETEAEFEESIQLSRHFDLPSFNAYQQRPGTPSLHLPPAIIQARQAQAIEEMRQRAQAGLPALRRWGQAPVSTVIHDTSSLYPWDKPEGKAWIQEQLRKFSSLITRKGPIPLGEGWVIHAAQAESDALVIQLLGPEKKQLNLSLRAPDWGQTAMAHTPRYAIAVCAEAFTPDPVQDRILKRFVAALGG